jgi:hypothetical protein
VKEDQHKINWRRWVAADRDQYLVRKGRNFAPYRFRYLVMKGFINLSNFFSTCLICRDITDVTSLFHFHFHFLIIIFSYIKHNYFLVRFIVQATYESMKASGLNFDNNIPKSLIVTKLWVSQISNYMKTKTWFSFTITKLRFLWGHFLWDFF